jgi:biopolymer transport protein ExbD
MKLKSTLPERAGFLHAIPGFDLLALLLMAILLGPSFLSQAGVEVELPVSKYRLTRHTDAAVITITPGDPPALWLGRERLDEEELKARLEARRAGSEESRPDVARVPMVYIRADAGVPGGVERQVAELALASGFRVYLLGRPQTDER